MVSASLFVNGMLSATCSAACTYQIKGYREYGGEPQYDRNRLAASLESDFGEWTRSTERVSSKFKECGQTKATFQFIVISWRTIEVQAESPFLLPLLVEEKPWFWRALNSLLLGWSE
jgi:hypothetical protein